jgi:hypothetical protein
VNPVPGVVNYFRGAAQRLANIPTYERILRRSVYPGVAAVYHGEEGRLEYDFVVAPGADASRIVIDFEGAQDVRLNDRAEIELTTAAGTLTQRSIRSATGGALPSKGDTSGAAIGNSPSSSENTITPSR